MQRPPSWCKANIIKFWGISSFGRASALHAEGERFDPVILHQSRLPLLNPVGNHTEKVIALLFAMSNQLSGKIQRPDVMYQGTLRKSLILPL